MGDGTIHHIQQLEAGQDVVFRPRGNSMKPIIFDKQEVTITPVSKLEKGVESIKQGDVVLCKVNGKQMLHLVTAIKGTSSNKEGKNTLQFQISNNHGHVNGWTAAKNIYGKLIAVKD